MSKKYANPPVEEALCEFYFLGSKWDSTLPGIFYDQVKSQFPDKSSLNQVNVEINVTQPTPEAKTTKIESRARFSSSDKSKMVQVSDNLLVVNQLKPYPEKFDNWKPVVSEMVKTYQRLASPTSISRIGIRFINKIVIPLPKAKLETYFNIYPQIPDKLAEHHENFLLRIEVPPKIHGHQVMISFSTAPAQPGTVGLLLDIYDILMVKNKSGFESLEKDLVDAHNNVEHAFESAITDKTRQDLFKEIKK